MRLRAHLTSLPLLLRSVAHERRQQCGTRTRYVRWLAGAQPRWRSTRRLAPRCTPSLVRALPRPRPRTQRFRSDVRPARACLAQPRAALLLPANECAAGEAAAGVPSAADAVCELSERVTSADAERGDGDALLLRLTLLRAAAVSKRRAHGDAHETAAAVSAAVCAHAGQEGRLCALARLLHAPDQARRACATPCVFSALNLCFPC